MLLSGFLPSIGPLITYHEPFEEMQGDRAAQVDNRVEISLPAGNGNAEPTTAFVRVDSGIVEGNTISMHYDPMISKLCTYAATRETAIAAMEEALDRYVISGLGNNLTFLRSVYGNARFRSGNYSTKFIGQEYSSGFTGVPLSSEEKNQLIAVAAAFHCGRPENARRMHTAATAAGDGFETDEDGFDFHSSDRLVVVLGGQKGTAYDVDLKIGFDLKAVISPHGGSDSAAAIVRVADLQWTAGQPLAFASFADASGDVSAMAQKAVQYLGRGEQCREANTGGEVYKLRFLGSDQEVIVRTPQEHKYSAHMLPPVVKDASKYLLCPMPGTLISCGKQHELVSF